jgi:hypothetical protein
MLLLRFGTIKQNYSFQAYLPYLISLLTIPRDGRAISRLCTLTLLRNFSVVETVVRVSGIFERVYLLPYCRASSLA